MDIASAPSPAPQPDAQDLCRQLITLFPLDTIEGKKPHRATISNVLWGEAQQNLKDMCALGADFSPQDRQLIETCAHIASICHLNHSRMGAVKLHYTSHLLAVGRLVDEEFKDDRSVCSVDPALAGFSTRAVAVATALMHDCIEDLWITVKHTGFGITPELAPEVARRFLAQHLAPVMGSDAAAAMVRLVDVLSIKNEDEFPTTEYITGIKENQICYAVKRADLTHNGSTAPTFCPTYPIAYIGAQYDEWTAGTPSQHRFRELLLLNLNSFTPEQRTGRRLTHLEEPADFDYFLRLIAQYEGPPGILRMSRTFADIQSELARGAFASFVSAQGLDADELVAKLTDLTKRLSSNVH